MGTQQKIRLDKLLSNLGYGSRREVGMAIRRGFFTLDGETVPDADAQINLAHLEAGRTLYDGQPLDPLAPLTIMLHKPAGYTCSREDPGEIVYALLPPRFAQRNPVMSCAGRLDRDSTGLVVMTDDGNLLHKIISPKSPVAKHYRLRTERPLRGDEPELFASGTLMLRGEKTPLKPAEMTISGPCEGEIVLHEGRYHQVRRMLAATGNHVTALHRFRIGNIMLDDLAEGAWRRIGAEGVF